MWTWQSQDPEEGKPYFSEAFIVLDCTRSGPTNRRCEKFYCSLF
jgi:hypothetical protein